MVNNGALLVEIKEHLGLPYFDKISVFNHLIIFILKVFHAGKSIILEKTSSKFVQYNVELYVFTLK